MKHNHKSQVIIFSIVLIMIGTYFTPVSLSKNLQYNNERAGRTIDGQILFAPMDSGITYLIDRNGTVNHTWSSSYLPGEAVYWLGDGTILRTIKTGISEAGQGGGVQKVQWDGTILWDFRYDTNGNLTHNDIKPLPNGDVLMIAWETKTRNQAIAAGRNPNNIPSATFMSDDVIEVKPTGPTSGDIVWEWHAWDHLIQDYDASKANYGVVGDHPELIDINFGTFFMNTDDWMHTDSIDYNPQFDQILLSVHNFNEIWIIDHSTTTEEAADHTGGNSGKGGDLLYRWGNSQAYRRGTSSDEKFFGQHDATWIESDCPGHGDILVFNNGLNRPGSQYSTVNEITTPVNDSGDYYLAPGAAYGPDAQTWMYTASPPTSFYSFYICGAQRLADGDTLICDGVKGIFFEVTPEGARVWQYVNPYPAPNMNAVFKIVYIPSETPPQSDLNCEGNISWTNIKPGGTVHGTFQVENIGSPNSTLNWTVDTYPTWGTWSFTPKSGNNLTPEAGPVTVQVNVTAPNQKNTQFEGYIRVVNKDNPDDFNLIPIYLKTPINDFVVSNTHVSVSINANIFSPYKRICDLFNERIPPVYSERSER